MNRLLLFFTLLLCHTTDIYSQLSEFKIKESNVPINWKEELIARGPSSQTKIGSFCKREVFNIKDITGFKSKQSFTESTLSYTIEKADIPIIHSSRTLSYHENNNIYLIHDSIKLKNSTLEDTKAYEIIYWSDKMIVTINISTLDIDINTGRKLTSTEIRKREKENKKLSSNSLQPTNKGVFGSGPLKECNKKFAPQVEIMIWD